MRIEPVATRLGTIVHRLTGRALDAADYKRSFFEWGADSLTLIQLARTIEVEFGARIPFRRFFGDLGSLAAIVDHLAAEAALSDGGVTEESPASVPARSDEPPSHTASEAVDDQAIREIVIRQLAVMEGQLAVLRRPAHADAGASVTIGASDDGSANASAASIGAGLRVEGGTPAVASSFGQERPYVPHRPADLSTTALDERQQRYVRLLTERLGRRSSGSRACAARQRRVLADPRLMTGFRPMWKDLVYPLYVESAQGSRIRDLDGYEYVDLCMGYGSYLFGHAPEFWTEALRGASALPIGPQNVLVGRVAALVTSLTKTARAAFFNSGTEAVMAALRAARTMSGRQRFAMFSGSYHGWSDQVLVQHRADDGSAGPSAPGVPSSAVADARLLPYGSDAALAILEREAGSLAAVLVEPVQSRRPELQPLAFLRRVREITAASGVALIFDEMITGFRSAPGGVQELWGIPADLAIYGKAAASGLPIGIVAGRADYMDAFDGGTWEYGDDSGPDAPMTFCAGTYFKHPLVMAGAEACLAHLQRHGPALQRDLNARVARWVDRLRARLEQHRLPVRVQAFSSLFRLHWDQPFPYAQLFYYALQERGVFAWEGGNFFVSTAHTDADLDFVASAIEACLLELRSSGFLPGGSAPSGTRAVEAPPSIASAVPLTPAQRDVWLAIEIGHAPSEAYNECITLELHGDLDVPALASGVEQLARRHEALRSVFERRGPSQTFEAPASVTIASADLTPYPDEERAARLEASLRDVINEPFDLERGRLLRPALVRTGVDCHVFALVFHHLILDNWSVGTLLRELPILYDAGRRAGGAHLPEPLSFAEYAREESDPQRQARAEAFWLERLHGVSCPPPQLPADGSRALPSTGAVACTRHIDSDVFDRLRAIAADAETTVVAAMLAAFETFLHRATGSDDVVVGVPVTGQPFMGPGPLVGYCLNVLPLRSRYNRHDTFTDIVRRVGGELAEALEHRTCSLSRLVERLSIKERGREHPLITSLFNYDVSGPPPTWPDLEVRSLPSPKAGAKLRLEINVSQEARALKVELIARSGVMTADTLARWLDVFIHVVTQGARGAHVATGALRLLGRPATDVLREWGSGARVPRPNETVPDLLERTAREHPERVAVVMAGAHVTYGELHRRARAFAGSAQSLGVGPDVLVPICLERSVEMVVCVLGILEAGGAYVPIDPTLVPERIAWMLDDCRPTLVFVDASTTAVVTPLLSPRCRAVDVASVTHGCNLRSIGCHPHHLAYVIYTSGSTGKPKGAMNAHAGVVNQLRWIQEALCLAAGDHVLQKTMLSFDASVWELFWPLSAGATVVLASRDAQFDPLALHRDIATHQVTTAIFVPSMLRELVALPCAMSPALRRVGCIGEAVTPALATSVRRRLPHAQFWNLYGPTETAVAVTAWRCDEASEVERVPIGRPIANTHVYVADGTGDLVPAGTEGELYLGGLGVGRGYWNRPDLTAGRFVPDEHGPAGARAYRTGDRVRYGADGQLEFIGRLDGQLKVRGYRIEIGEIEAVMAQHPGVAEAAVWARGSGADLILAAAWTGAARESEMRGWLAARLPRYMVPSQLTGLASLPHLPNGKLDRPALAQRQAGTLVDERDATVPDPIEGVVQGIWEHVLGRRVARTDSFVTAGGHSLHATQVINRIATTFGVTLQIRTLFEDASVATLGSRIAASLRGREMPPPAPVARTCLLATSAAQERFWFLEQLFAGTGACNLPLAVRITGPLQVPALRSALDAVVARHEVLRSTFELTDDGAVCQRMAPSLRTPWELREGNLSDALRWAQAEAKRQFDLSRGPLLHSVLVAVGPEDWIWLLTLHHIVADAWSIQILWREVSVLYRAAVTGSRAELPPLPLQYADFAAWQRAQLGSGVLSGSLAYWRKQLADPPAPIRWSGRDTPVLPVEAGDVSAQVSVGSAVVAALSGLMRSAAATQSMVVVAALEIVVWNHATQTDFLAGVPIHGRNRSEFEPMIGCFVNMLPIRARVHDDRTFAELLAEVRSHMLEAYAHADLPFEMAISDRTRAARSLVGLVVSTRNVPMHAAAIPELVCAPFEAAHPVSSHELLCEVGDTPNGWSIELTGSAELFAQDTIARLGEHLLRVLADVAADPNRTAASLFTVADTAYP